MNHLDLQHVSLYKNAAYITIWTAFLRNYVERSSKMATQGKIDVVFEIEYIVSMPGHKTRFVLIHEDKLSFLS